MSYTDCRTSEGISVGIIDSIITMLHLIRERGVSDSGAVSDAIVDLVSTLMECDMLKKYIVLTEDYLKLLRLIASLTNEYDALDDEKFLDVFDPWRFLKEYTDSLSNFPNKSNTI